MQQLLKDIEQVVDFSPSESKQLINAFKDFLDRKFHLEPEPAKIVFRFPAHHFLNQQEDEDNHHSLLTEEVLY
jgi:hypothetical protein